jgi:hypothetical protein
MKLLKVEFVFNTWILTYPNNCTGIFLQDIDFQLHAIYCSFIERSFQILQHQSEYLVSIIKNNQLPSIFVS